MKTVGIPGKLYLFFILHFQHFVSKPTTILVVFSFTFTLHKFTLTNFRSLRHYSFNSVGTVSFSEWTHYQTFR